MYHKSGLPWTRHWDFILLDMLSMFLSQIIAYYIYVPTDFQLSGSPEYLVLLFGLPLVDFVVIVLFSTMDGVLQRGLLRELYATVKNTAAVFSTEAVVLFVVKMADFYSRKNFGYACVTYFCLSYLMRVATSGITRSGSFRKTDALCWSLPLPRIWQSCASGSRTDTGIATGWRG